MSPRSHLLCLGLLAPLLVFSDARAADHDAGASFRPSLMGVSMFQAMPDAAWPFELTWEVVEIGVPGSQPRAARTLAASGQRVALSQSVGHDLGHDIFRLDVVARHHEAGETEIEYRLTVHRAAFERMELGAYMQHRLGLGDGPTLGDETLYASRADIVAGSDVVAEQEVEIEGRPYVVRVRARSVEG